MARRVSMPAADDLFRPTADGSVQPANRERRVRAVSDDTESNAPRRPSGRVRHDEKMTVYITAEELLDIEHARLVLRRDHGLGIDRGRLVREAVAMVLADLEEHGDESALVRRLVEE